MSAATVIGSPRTCSGLALSGVNPELNLVEMIELPGHPYFVGCQFHPEFKSKPFAPHPLFSGFVKAALRGIHAPRAPAAPRPAAGGLLRSPHCWLEL